MTGNQSHCHIAGRHAGAADSLHYKEDVEVARGLGLVTFICDQLLFPGFNVIITLFLHGLLGKKALKMDPYNLYTKRLLRKTLYPQIRFDSC